MGKRRRINALDVLFDRQREPVVEEQQGRNSNIATLFDAGESRHSGVAHIKSWPWVVAGIGLALAALAWVGFSYRQGDRTAAPMPPAQVTVSKPLLRDVDTRIGLLGQFSAINRVELRAQVGGTLTEIHFQDGQIVIKGDLLFVIDPRPYEIKLAQANAQLADRIGALRARHQRAWPRAVAPAQQFRNRRDGRPAHGRAERCPGRDRRRQGADPRRPARPRIHAASPRRSPAASARVSSRSAAWSPAAAPAAARRPC